MTGREATPCLYGRDPKDCPACQEAAAIHAGRDASPQRVIVGGNLHQARTYLQEQGWEARDCIVLGSPMRLRGVRGPVEVHRIGTYWSDRPARFIEEVEESLRVIEATTPPARETTATGRYASSDTSTTTPTRGCE